MRRESVGAPAATLPVREPARLSILTSLWTRPDFLMSVVVGALGLALAYYWLLLRVTTLHTMVSKLSSQPLYLALLAVLAPAALLLFGLNFGVLGLSVRARAQLRGQGGSFLGIVIGGFGAGCPSCGAFLLSLVGVSAGVSALPFGGLELWLISCVIMALTFRRSLRALQLKVCDASGTANACPRMPAVSRVQLVILTALGLALAGMLLWAVATNESQWFLPAG